MGPGAIGSATGWPPPANPGAGAVGVSDVVEAEIVEVEAEAEVVDRGADASGDGTGAGTGAGGNPGEGADSSPEDPGAATTDGAAGRAAATKAAIASGLFASSHWVNASSEGHWNSSVWGSRPKVCSKARINSKVTNESTP